jgi:uncharacterized protein YbaR (Trm112 family)
LDSEYNFLDYFDHNDYHNGVFNFLKSLTDLNSDFILNLIFAELKKLLKSKSIKSKIFACNLIRQCYSFEENIPNMMEETGLIESFLQMFKKNKYFKLQLRLFSVFSPLIPWMIRNGRESSIDFISSHFWIIFENDAIRDRNSTIPHVIQIINTCNQFQFPLKINSYEMMDSIVNFNSLRDDLCELICALFHESFKCDASNRSVTKIIQYLIDLRIYWGSSSNCICLKTIFHCIQLDSRPWIYKIFEYCVKLLGSRYTETTKGCLLLILEMIQIFKEDIEPVIIISNLIELIVPLIKVEFYLI